MNKIPLINNYTLNADTNIGGDLMYKVEITGIDTSKLEVLSNDVMNDLLYQIKNNQDIDARNKMIKGNLKLVLSVLKKFNNRKENVDDLFQVGCIGLMKAIDNFDLSHNVRFSTYAVPMIIGEIRRHLRDNGMIRVSRSLKDIAYKAIGLKEQHLREHQTEMTLKEIADVLMVEESDVIMALEAIQDTVSMSKPIYDNGGDVIELSDQLGANDETMENFIRDKMLNDAFKHLNKREKRIIYSRYYDDKTQTEIALELGISQAQVSRLEKNALKTMYEVLK